MAANYPFQDGSIEPVQPQPKSSYFYFLDALRGIAALWVVLYHLDFKRLPALAQILPQPLIQGVFRSGSLGVALFFVLSGFVIAHSLRQAQITWPYLKTFTLRRWLRLSPPYYVSMVFCMALALLSARVQGESWQFPGLDSLVAHGLYLQDILGLPPISEVYWTLCLEFQFYLAFAALLWLAQHGERAGATPPWYSQGLYGLAAGISLIWPLWIQLDTRPNYFLPHWYGFLVGVFAYWTWKKQWPTWAFYTYSGLLILGAIAHHNAFTLACALSAIALLLVAQAQKLGEWLNQQWLQFLGKISYSLYLFHGQLLGACLFVGPKVLGQGLLAEILTLLGAIALCIGTATAGWWLFERPAIAWSKQLAQHSQAKNGHPSRQTNSA